MFHALRCAATLTPARWKNTLDVRFQKLSFVGFVCLFVCVASRYLNNLAGIASRLICAVFSFEVDEVCYNTVCAWSSECAK